MANETRLLLTVNNGAPAYQSVVDVSEAGTWAALTISLRILAFKSSAETDADLVGVNRSAVAGWDNISVPLNRKVKLTFIKPTDYVDHYAFCYQVGATFDPASSANLCTATFTHTTYTQCLCQVADDDNYGTLTVGSSPTSLGLFTTPVDNEPRQNSEIGCDGIGYRRSWATDVENQALLLELLGYACSTAGYYNTLRKWAQYAVNLKADDGDTNARIATYYGLLSQPRGIDSLGKSKDWPALRFLVTGEDYN